MAASVSGVQTSTAGQLYMSEEEVCSISDWILIGTVVETQAFMEHTPGIKQIKSVITLDVEAVAHGSPPGTVNLLVPGGELNGVRAAALDSPAPRVGTRYLFLLNVRERTHSSHATQGAEHGRAGDSAAQDTGRVRANGERRDIASQDSGNDLERIPFVRTQDGTIDERTYEEVQKIAIVAWWTLKPSGILPSDDQLNAVWEEHCSPALQTGQDAQPTQLYRQFIPSELLDWCGHY